VFVIRAMSRNPELSVMPDRSEKDNGDAIQEEEDEEDEDEDDDEEEEEDDGEEDAENEEENDDDIGEAAVAAPVETLPAYTPIKPKKGDKSDSKTSSAVGTHTPSSSSSSSSSSVSKGRDSTGRSAVKGKGKSILDDEHTVEGGGEGEGEEEAVDGCRWVMQRLKGLGSDPRGRKRLHVIRVSTYMPICQSYIVSFHHYLLSFQYGIISLHFLSSSILSY
jgi:hypothetical protein